MPTLGKVGSKIRYSVDRLDGGLNIKDAPSRIPSQDSPDCLNVIFDRRGAVVTRNGSKVFNTDKFTNIYTNISGLTNLSYTAGIQKAISYNNEVVAIFDGSLYYSTGTTSGSFTFVTQSSGQFLNSGKIATVIYQNVLFLSDGNAATRGPWKYTGGENFYKMGIEKPAAPTGWATAAVSTAIQPGTYYYGCSFVNTQVVEGEISSATTAYTLAVTGTIAMTVPVGSTLAGVNERWIYRAESASGPFRRVGTLANNTSVVFTDTTPNGQEGKLPVLDGTSPTAFSTIALHKERLFFNDPNNASLLRWTDYTNPYVSQAENFEPINNGDGQIIRAIISQDDVLTVFKDNVGFGITTPDPSDSLTWKKIEHPANLGCLGPEAFVRIPNGVVFIGRRNNRITGVHFLTGLQVIESNDGRLRSLTISEKIEQMFFDEFLPLYYNTVSCGVYDNRIYITYASGNATFDENDTILWMDLNRIGSEGQPGSWSKWTGIHSAGFFNHLGNWFSYDSSRGSMELNSTNTQYTDYWGHVRQLEIADTYNDSGRAINSYFWTKEVGGNVDDPAEGPLEAYVKDIRDIYLWYSRLGSYYMNVAIRADGDAGAGNSFEVNLDPGLTKWGSMVWGVDDWGGERYNYQKRIPIGRMIGRRFQLRFDNQNQVDQGFKVNRVEMDFNIRRRR